MAKPVKAPGNCELVFQRKADALGLHTIAKGSIVKLYLFHNNAIASSS